jgi:hypothetical protein
MDYQDYAGGVTGDDMDRDDIIDKLWENSNHGTRREDVVAAFEAGIKWYRLPNCMNPECKNKVESEFDYCDKCS